MKLSSTGMRLPDFSRSRSLIRQTVSYRHIEAMDPTLERVYESRQQALVEFAVAAFLSCGLNRSIAAMTIAVV
jgi:hypothetical protein